MKPIGPSDEIVPPVRAEPVEASATLRQAQGERLRLQNAQPIGKPLPITYAGHSVWLLPEHALWWPEARVLFIADLHMGKAATYRALGQPVPSGTTAENLRRLSQLIAHYQPTQLVFLGDFLHARAARTASVLGQIEMWRQSHASLTCTLVRGNHDSRAGDPPAHLNISVVDEPYLVGPFAACHHPQTHPTHAVLAGHVHPAVQLQGAARDRLRLPCFVLDSRSAILPAFGEFTGGYTVEPKPGVQLYAAGGGSVWPLSGSFKPTKTAEDGHVQAPNKAVAQSIRAQAAIDK